VEQQPEYPLAILLFCLLTSGFCRIMQKSAICHHV